jgi:predicted glutamine amidotransferase
MWMHNGGIGEFDKIKRTLQNQLPDELFTFPQGNTDSEWTFALYLSKLPDRHASDFPHSVLQKAMLDTIKSLNEMAAKAGVKEPSLMNFCVTDGRSVVATRYVSSKHDEAASLYFSSGTTFSEYESGGHYRMSKMDKREDIIMIASEPLTFEKADWMEIKTNTMIVVTPKMNVLQIPIKDEFYVAPSEQASHKRTAGLAAEKGLFHPRAPVQSGFETPIPEIVTQ